MNGRAATSHISWSLLVLAGCHSARTNLTVVVTAQDGLPPIARVDVTASARGHTSSASAAGLPVAWPVTLTLDISSLPGGDAILEATASDETQTKVARRTLMLQLPIATPVPVELLCQSLDCSSPPPDGGTDGPATLDGEADGASGSNPTCGNGRLDPGETCDITISPELPGACPEGCDDGIACTKDETVGSSCTASCTHLAILVGRSADGCCPAHLDNRTDTDCSPMCGNQRVDPGETCDTAITAGVGMCPNRDACDDRDPCTVDQLISEQTCSARCTHALVSMPTDGDGCCPVAADSSTDADCEPLCGNGIVEPSERCDRALTRTQGGCPTAADCDDHDPCTFDFITGSGCQAVCVNQVIDVARSGDGCCPALGLNRNIDSDCPASCGNGVLEAGETCDQAVSVTESGACPASCPAPPDACVRYVMQGSAADCSAACTTTILGACSSTTNGCCPTGCTNANDPDCPATCGNGTLDPGETCETAVSGAGPASCPRTCTDGNPCTQDLLIGGGTCTAHCIFIPISAPRNGDGCCPPGAHAGVDADCPAICGNGVVEGPFEMCDTATSPPSCPTSCPVGPACISWRRTMTSGCDIRCTPEPVTACIRGDGCCPANCSALDDSDCAALCGNALLEPGESCDHGITAGHLGACPASCADSDPCTLDFARGTIEGCTRACSHVRITACGGGDRCCPTGCNADTDSDCNPRCRNAVVEAGETCDPMSTCPTSCPSDGDPCTVDQLVGAAATCNAACTHAAILRCSGTQRDGCCPTECSTASDSDC